MLGVKNSNVKQDDTLMNVNVKKAAKDLGNSNCEEERKEVKNTQYTCT